MSNFPFQRLQADLAGLISRTAAGNRLPSEPDLAKTLGVSRATLREAMRSFETQGLIRRRQGSGTFVTGRIELLESGLEVLESIDAVAKRLGLEVTASELKVQSEVADEEIATRLDIHPGDKVTRVSRVVHADHRPVAFVLDILPETVFAPNDLPVEYRGSVIDFLLGRGDVLAFSRARISAIGATAEVAKAIQIQRGDVLLHFNSILFSTKSEIVGLSESYFIPGYFQFNIVRRVPPVV